MSLELTQKLFNKGGQIVVSSRVVANDFNKRSADVLEKIDNLKVDLSSTDFSALFIESQYNGQIVVSSRVVANDFNKRSADVLEKIDNLKVDLSSTDFSALFIESQYKASNGKMNKEYLLTRDGFSLIVMGFTGGEALQWKLKYIEAFNKMEEIIKNNIPQISKISKRQELILNIVDSKNQFEMASAIKELEEYTHQVAHHEGAKSICDDSVITRPVVAKYIRECYGEELKELGVPLYDSILNREFSSFLESKGYITPTRFPKKNGDGLEEKVHFQPLQPFLDYFVEILNREFSSFLESKGYITPTRFPKKNGDGLEEKVHFQPLQPFLDYFVENSMAIVKDLNDGRGKIIFNYTKNIEEYITSKEFYDEFMKYIEKIYTNEEEEIISLL